MTADALARIAFALALGLVGALIARAIAMPLPWMLGPMCACTLAALLRAPIKGPMAIRPPMIMVLGVLLGSGFTPAVLDRLGEWAASLGMLAVYIAAVGALAYPYFRRLAGYDPVTAYFAGMPGGLTEMMLVGRAYGGDDRRIVLTHASRVLLSVLAIPIFFRLTTDIDMTDRARFGVSLAEVPLRDYAVLTACALAGWPLARLARVPAAMLVGPMVASAAVHLAGLSSAQPPREIVNLAQWAMGTIIGCRFIGTAPAEVLRVMRYSVGATAIMLALTVVFGWLLWMLVGVRVDAVVLAYAPGGLAEMTLVALALGADVAFVATHHLVRIVLVVVCAPAVFRLTGITPRADTAETPAAPPD